MDCIRWRNNCFLTEILFLSIFCGSLAAFMNYDRRLTVNLQSTLSRDPTVDVGIVLKELTPRRRLREEHVLLTVDFPGTQHEFTLVLERIRGRVTIATKEWGRVRLQHLPVKGLSERSYHRGLFLHVTPATSESMSRMQVYLDCKWQGYFMMPLSLYQMAKEAAGNKLRAERDRKIKVQVIRNSSLQRALEEAGCPPPDTQAIQPSSEFYTVNGKKDESDELLRSLSELTSVLKEMRRYMDMQVLLVETLNVESKLLRDAMSDMKKNNYTVL